MRHEIKFNIFSILSFCLYKLAYLYKGLDFSKPNKKCKTRSEKETYSQLILFSTPTIKRMVFKKRSELFLVNRRIKFSNTL